MGAPIKQSNILIFQGHQYFRHRLLLSLLSGKPIRIEKIRPDDEHPGLRDYEANFLKLMDSLTNGSMVEINHTGTTVQFKPGVIMGGKVQHAVPVSKSIGYVLEPLMALAPFAKNPCVVTLTGITNPVHDISVDAIRTVALPLLQRFGVDDGIELKISKRGAPPLGGGEVLFKCSLVRQLKPVQFVDPGRIKRIRGIAYCTRVAPSTANRIGETARGVLNRYIPDVFMYTDVYKGAESGLSPGFGLCLVAETTTSSLFFSEWAAEPGVSPEDVGENASKQLLAQVPTLACVDTCFAWLSLLLMVLGPQDVSTLRIASLSPFTIHFLRDIRSFFGTTFNIKPVQLNQQEGPFEMTCVGTGFINYNKKSN